METFTFSLQLPREYEHRAELLELMSSPADLAGRILIGAKVADSRIAELESQVNLLTAKVEMMSSKTHVDEQAEATTQMAMSTVDYISQNCNTLKEDLRRMHETFGNICTRLEVCRNTQTFQQYRVTQMDATLTHMIIAYYDDSIKKGQGRYPPNWDSLLSWHARISGQNDTALRLQTQMRDYRNFRSQAIDIVRSRKCAVSAI